MELQVKIYRGKEKPGAEAGLTFTVCAISINGGE